MTNENVHELAAAYALDALAADERQEFETHLLECEQCRGELASLRETVGALALSTEGPAPAAELRDRILVAAREEQPKVVALRPRRARRLYAGGAATAAACVALGVGLWLGLSGGSNEPRLALSPSANGVAELTVSGFRAAPPGKTYEVWVIAAGAPPRRAGLFRGGETQVVRLTRRAPRGSTVAVTLERAGGVPAPTTPILEQTTVSA